jgi:hypothetical protein
LGPITTASVVGANSIFALTAVDAVDQDDAAMPEEVEQVLVEQAIASTPVSEPPAARALAPVTVAAVAAEPAPKKAAPTKPAGSIGGWKIQFAAVPTEAAPIGVSLLHQHSDMINRACSSTKIIFKLRSRFGDIPLPRNSATDQRRIGICFAR